MNADWRRFLIILAVTFAACLAVAYAVFDDWVLALKDACRTTPFWAALVFWVTRTFRQELSRPKWHERQTSSSRRLGR